MSDEPILGAARLGFPWGTLDPFLFCVHHRDDYPAGNERQGPVGSLAGRQLGMDFEVRDGFRMYHGREVPGFPRHPHRGFETVTLVRRGLIDHSDSLGAAARFGGGDTQWLTAGAGIEHAEMFPLVRSAEPNPLELFQIWLNLPRADKLAPPHFTMLWAHQIPRVRHVDRGGRGAEITLVAGALGDRSPPPPPPRSWAARPEADLAIWTLRLEPGAEFELPAARPGTNRMLYFFDGASLSVAGEELEPGLGVSLRGEARVPLVAGEQPVDLLYLAGRPIGEPVVQHGPFVMNSRAEIVEAFRDYERGAFGRWPFGDDAPVNPRDRGRFARHPDGRVEEPPAQAEGGASLPGASRTG